MWEWCVEAIQTDSLLVGGTPTARPAARRRSYVFKNMNRKPAKPEENPWSDHRKQNYERGRSKGHILTMVQRVAELRGVEAALLLSEKRGTEAIASARSLVMAACATMGVPLCHIARTFQRKWETVYTAELTCARRYRNSAKFRKEWDEMTRDLDE